LHFSRALPQFAHRPNHRSYGLGPRENRFELRRFGYDPHPHRGDRFLRRPGFSTGWSFTHVEAIRILLAFAVSKRFKLYQMDVKSAFLNGVIQEEVYVRKPSGFESPKYPDRVHKLSKALHGLKQAPRAWYARLKTFLLEHKYVMGSVDKALFTLNHSTDFLLIQIYVDDIIFGGSSHTLVSRF
jgi:hypothetical protein